MPGLAERLKYSLERLAPKGTAVDIAAAPNAQMLSWIGGARAGMFLLLDARHEDESCSIVHSPATSGLLGGHWLTKDMYKELGPRASLAS